MASVFSEASSSEASQGEASTTAAESTPGQLELRVDIEPPVSLTGHRWQVLLSRKLDGHQLAITTADEHGTVVFDRLEPALLEVTVRAFDVGEMYQEHFRLSSDRERLIELTPITVTGRLTLEGEPLRGTVEMPPQVATRHKAELDSEGRFKSWILEPPRRDELFLRVHLEEGIPPALVSVDDYTPQDLEDDRTIELEVDLQDLRISGTVTSSDNQPVRDAEVRIVNSLRGSGTRTARDGSFVFRLLQPERYRVSAVHSEHGKSAIERVGLDAATPRHQLELVLQAPRKVRGTVVDPDGRPVRLASITALSLGPHDVQDDQRSDEAGRFEIEVAPQAQKVLLSVSRFAYGYWSACVDAPLDGELRITLPIHSGTLERVDTAEPPQDDSRPRLILVNDQGGLMPHRDTLTWPTAHGLRGVTYEKGQRTIHLPNLAPGQWAIAWTSADLWELIQPACDGSLFAAEQPIEVYAGATPSIFLDRNN